MPYMIEHSDFVTLAALGSGRGVSRAQKLHMLAQMHPCGNTAANC
jgi:hypothetical protein